MLYDKTGRVVDRYPEKQRAGAKLAQVPGKEPVLKLSPHLVKGFDSLDYELLIGRGKHREWVGLWFNKKKMKMIDGRVKLRPLWCTTKLKAFKCMRHQDFEDLEYAITKEALFVRIPIGKGLVEQTGWWLSLPDVRDNPQDSWSEVRDMHGMWGYGGTPTEDDSIH